MSLAAFNAEAASGEGAHGPDRSRHAKWDPLSHESTEEAIGSRMFNQHAKWLKVTAQLPWRRNRGRDRAAGRGARTAVFGLWSGSFDRGGPVARALGTRPYPDFQFVQMASPQLAPPDWEPAFADYLYLAFTNAAAFSPTDVMPLSRWAKLAMTLQSAVSIVTVVLIVARAVNILK